MTINISRFAAILVVALSACATPAPKFNARDPEAVRGAVVVSYDAFKKMTSYKGPEASEEREDSVFLRAWKADGAAEVSYQIYVMDYYGGDWRFYNSAFDIDGVRLDTTLISRDVGSCSRYGCSHYEHLGINVSRAYLEAHQPSGVRFKVSGKAGDEIFFLPSGYVRGFLSAIK